MKNISNLARKRGKVYRDNLTELRTRNSSVYSHFNPGFGVLPESVQGKPSVQGNGTRHVQGKNHQTTMSFRVNSDLRPTTIERVAPVGQGNGQPARRESFYHHRDSGCAMFQKVSTRRDEDGF